VQEQHLPASQVLNLLALLVQKYLLYWYVRRDRGSLLQQLRGVAAYLFYWYKSTFTDAWKNG
jgi:hypothetical protein